ncbi:hypothetical protein [Aquipuribacter sp. SD81]|uniref:hypothetical protein n=1 Tax=Aquipuribacter sp. SD81 TaxID=3127703 RepID=UPI00301A756F
MDAGADVRPLVAHPAVVGAVAEAREACTGLRWLPAMRRRAEQVRAESCVRAAAASAELDGARLGLDRVRALLAVPPERGATERAASGHDRGPAGRAGVDPVTALVLGALRVTLDAHPSAPLLSRAPRQVMARFHALAAADLVADPSRLGRPSGSAAERLELLSRLVSGRSPVPTLVTAALVDAEVTAGDAFAPVSGVVARALARAVVVDGGLDPAGVVVPERHALADRAGRDAALAGYRSGDPDAVAAWVRWWGDAVVAGAVEAGRVAEEVMAGRLVGTGPG